MEILTMSKKELLDKFQDCVDDASIRLIVNKEEGEKGNGNVIAYSEEFCMKYYFAEILDRLSIELKREFNKIIVCPDGKAELYVCENEALVKKYRDKARYEICTDKEYNALVKQAAHNLCLTNSDADVLLGGYGMY